MKILRSRPFQRSLPPALLVTSLLAAYLSTLAPGLSWANGGSDGGDLITAAATGGVPHPTGYPLYLLCAEFFQLLPVGSLAFRTNLMSSVFAVLAAWLAYKIVLDFDLPSPARWPAALVSGYAFGLAPLVWSQAVIAEVYTLQASLIALSLYLYARPSPTTEADRKRLDRWRGLALGLAISNHVTAILLLPAALLAGSVRRASTAEGSEPAARVDASSLRRQFASLVVGLTPYLMIPLRAFGNPPVNWGNATTLSRFWWLVSGDLYRSYYLQFSIAEAPERVQAWAALFTQQLGLPVLVLGLIGLIVFWRSSPLYLLTTWTAFVFTAFAFLYGASDSYVYLIPVMLSFAIWAGLGTDRLTHRFRQQTPVAGIVLGLIVIAYFAVRAPTLTGQVDASKDTRAERFARDVLSAAPRDAILFAKGDEAIFALWYAHYAMGQRPDLAILAVDLLHFDWYQENLRATYPSLMVPGPFPWPETVAGANPSRGVCHVQYGEQVQLDCLPPAASPEAEQP